ncbi:hypothetical protein [Parenemella sanctibonifatiensis]|uniref:Tetratricopeptide repeat protein n=1 Tax=Parenemella sanctibonifatiensis TaxID=2016505 RepID=A0A255DZ74_9ACTN|nr:hypothetical protein [Parenemella sanctibonifatiensis]OYN84594.1 hypothetical protein CGZ92_12200 [Parenemella sanctibonifatiensis]
MISEDDVWDLYDEVDALPLHERVSAAQRFHSAATALGDPALMFWADAELASAWCFGPTASANAVPHFAACVRAMEQQPAWWEGSMTLRVLWDYKSTLETVAYEPSVSLAVLEDLLGSMERNYRRFGHSTRSVLMMTHLIRTITHGAAAADGAFRAWTAMPRDPMADCEGCEPTRIAEHLSATERYEEAATLAQRTVDDARFHCPEQPLNILATGLEPFLRTGRDAQATTAYRTAVRIASGRADEVGVLGGCVQVAARAGQLDRALALVEGRRHEDRFPTTYSRMIWQATVALVLRLVAERDPDRMVRVGPGEAEPGAEARRRLERSARELAATFDQRNGTAASSDLVQKLIEAGQLPTLQLG